LLRLKPKSALTDRGVASNRTLIDTPHISLMLQTMDRAPASAEQGEEPRLAAGHDLVDSTRKDGLTTTGTNPANGAGQAASALAYELLLPNRITSIASVGVAGKPALARIGRDGTTMNWCELKTESTPASSTGPTKERRIPACDGRSLPFPDGSLDCIVLHGTLDHWRDARTLLAATGQALAAGGIVAISVDNAFEPSRLKRRLGSGLGGFGKVTGGKLRSLRGYRRLLRGSGFEPIASYFVLQKPGAAPSRIISTTYAPSTAFFSHQIATLTGPKRFLMRGLNALNLLPHVQSRFLILARK
jgi:SAM-dependent methyltransferase